MSAPKKCALQKSKIEIARELGTLGEGAFGVVKLIETVSGKYLALKECKLDEMTNERKYIIQEICIQQALTDCEFIVTNYGYNETKEKISIYLDLGAIDMKCFFNVRSYREAENKEDDNKSATTTFTELTEYIIHSILQALKYMHAKKISHRDVKCENVLLFSDGSVKLSDMGFSKYDENNLKTCCGTDGFMAPEIFTSSRYTVIADLWSLGVTIMECANSDRLFELQEKAGLWGVDTNPEEVEQFYDDLVELSKSDIILSRLNDRLKEVLTNLLQQDPSDRMGAKNIINTYFSNYRTDAALIKSDLAYVGKRVIEERIQTIKNSKKKVKLVGYKGRNLCECGSAWVKTNAETLQTENDEYDEGACCDSCQKEMEMKEKIYHCGNISFHGFEFDFCSTCVKQRNMKLRTLQY